MKAPLLLHFLFQVVLLYDASGWEVKMPKEIHGLQGSCLVIPCSYNYTSKPPKDPRRVVWYQWVSRGYPLVYDPLHTNNVIEKFRGKTDLYGNSSWDCSLLIKNLDPSHHREMVYTWIDPENVGRRTYAFYEVTSTILVDASPQPPSINIYGGERTGETITVVCSAFHTCPYSKPNISLNGIEGADQIDHEHIEDGLWKINLTRTDVMKAENSTIECSVTYHGGITVKATKDKTVQLNVHNEADPVHTDPKTIGLYLLAPSFVFLLVCIIAGFIIYKKRHRQPLNYMQRSLTQPEQRQFIMSEGREAWSNKESRTDNRGNVYTGSACMPPPKCHEDYDSEDGYSNIDEHNVYENVST